MIASLMMYARPQLEGAHNRLWELIRCRLTELGVESPLSLSQEVEEFSVWLDPSLVLSQTCGMPYRMVLHKHVKLVGTPDYGLDGCPQGYYRSAIVIRKDDLRSTFAEFKNTVFAFNVPHSQSGYSAAYWHARQNGFWFTHTLETGQHLASAMAVANGEATIASIDAVTWQMILRHEPFAQKLRVLEWTTPTPGLPLITSLEQDEHLLFAAVNGAIEDLSAADKELLAIKDLVAIPSRDYLSIANPDLPECVIDVSPSRS